PPGLEGFLHFTSSTTSGSASLMRARSRESVSPRQSPSSLILASINSDGDPGFCGALFFTTSLSYHIDSRTRQDRASPRKRFRRFGQDDLQLLGNVRVVGIRVAS